MVDIAFPGDPGSENPTLPVGVNTVVLDSYNAATDYGQVIMDKLEARPTSEIDGRDYGYHLILPPGLRHFATPVSVDQSTYGAHIVIEGSGHIATTLNMPRELGIVGIDARDGREFELRNIRMLEWNEGGGGEQTSTLILLGGTTCKAFNCWAGNAKRGIVGTGAGSFIESCTAEFCKTNFLFCSGLVDAGNGIPAAFPNNNRACVVSNLQSYEGPTRFIRYVRLVLNVTSGTLAEGDTITATGGSIPATIEGVDSDNVAITLAESSELQNDVGFTTSGGATGTVTTRGFWQTQTLIVNGLMQRRNENGLNKSADGYDLIFDGVDNVEVQAMLQHCDPVKITDCTNSEFSIKCKNTDRGSVCQNSTGIMKHIGNGQNMVITGGSMTTLANL